MPYWTCGLLCALAIALGLWIIRRPGERRAMGLALSLNGVLLFWLAATHSISSTGGQVAWWLALALFLVLILAGALLGRRQQPPTTR